MILWIIASYFFHILYTRTSIFLRFLQSTCFTWMTRKNFKVKICQKNFLRKKYCYTTTNLYYIGFINPIISVYLSLYFPSYTHNNLWQDSDLLLCVYVRQKWGSMSHVAHASLKFLGSRDLLPQPPQKGTPGTPPPSSTLSMGDFW